MGVFLAGGYGRLSFGVTGASRSRTASRDIKHMTAMHALARVHEQIVAGGSGGYGATSPASTTPRPLNHHP